MAKKDYVVGLELEAYCTACKEDRSHTIETLKSDGNINRVNCHFCKDSHLFRRPKSEAALKALKKPRRKKGAIIVTEDEAKKAKKYAMTTVFAPGDFVNHKIFGAGKVVEVRANKMEVGFEDGPKLLACRHK